LQTCLQLALGIGSSDHMACARSDFFDPWSGGAVLTLELKHGPCTATWHIALDASRVGGLVDSGFDTAAPDHPMPLASVASALQGSVLRVQLLMNEVELSVGQLQSLQVDDLIVIPHSIDQPLNVAIEPATSATPRLTLCHAHLGTRNGHLAMELLATEGLARHDTPDTPTSHSVSSTLLSPSH